MGPFTRTQAHKVDFVAVFRDSGSDRSLLSILSISQLQPPCEVPKKQG